MVKGEYLWPIMLELESLLLEYFPRGRLSIEILDRGREDILSIKIHSGLPLEEGMNRYDRFCSQHILPNLKRLKNIKIRLID